MPFFIIASFILLHLTFTNTLDFWLSYHIETLSRQEQELIFNALDSAIQRCNATLMTQDVAATLVEYIHQETNFVSETRLQPAKCSEESINASEILYQWHRQKKQYIEICLAYDTIISLIDSQPHLLEAFNYVRQEARSAVLKATAYESYRLKDCAITLTEYGQQALSSLHLLNTLLGKRSVLDDITQWFTSLLITPFKQCNDQITLINDQSWTLVEKQQIFGNYVWKIIEEARLKIYKQYYYALAVKLKKDVKELLHEN